MTPERGLYLDEFSDAVLVFASFQDVAEAAEGGCSSCLLLRDCVVAFKGRDVLESIELVEVTVKYFTGATMIVTIADSELFTRPG